MNDIGKRVHSIIIKNLPTNYTENQLEELFSKFGRIVSSKMLPSNPNFDGGCGFVNYAEADSCAKAVENMNNFSVDRFSLRVAHSNTRMDNNNHSDRQQNGVRVNGESNDENNGTSSPGVQTRFSGFRPASTRSPTTPLKINSLNEPETSSSSKPSWNGTNTEQQNVKNSLQNETVTNIREHDSLIINNNYCVYLSNLEVPNIIFAAMLDDYVNATLLITNMNKNEQLSNVQTNSFKTKWNVGQFCAALFNGDWYRARILEVDENCIHVQYIDWGNSGWCDSILEIRPLPNDYHKDPILCIKCILDGIPTGEKLSDEQANAILEILVLDVKLDMTVLRIENGIPYVQLRLGERNLNDEIHAILPQSTTPTIPQNSNNEPALTFDSNKPEMNPSEVHSVQLTTVDTESECFHVLLVRDCVSTIMNVLKDWDVHKQPLTTQPKENMLVCAQYEADDLWYRAWVGSVAENGFRVYFVDFGNEEVVSTDRITECPDALKNIPWQSVQIKLANIKLTDDERYLLLRDFETDKLDMKILSKNQEIYSVDLFQNGKSLTEYMFDLRKKKEQPTQDASIKNEVPKESIEPVQQPVIKAPTPPPVTKIESVPQIVKENTRPISSPVRPFITDFKPSVESNSNNKFLPPPPPPTITATKVSNSTVTPTAKPVSSNEHSTDNIFTDNLTAMITEQRRQNRLLEQVIAAINTTNALLTQLVQR